VVVISSDTFLGVKDGAAQRAWVFCFMARLAKDGIGVAMLDVATTFGRYGSRGRIRVELAPVDEKGQPEIKGSKVRIGTLYVNHAMFAEDAGATVGAPAIGPEAETIMQNRHEVQGKLTPEGKSRQELARTLLEEMTGCAVELNWSIHAGCRMCPCSPGWIVYARIDTTHSYGQVVAEEIRDVRRENVRRDSSEVTVSIEADGHVDVRFDERWERRSQDGTRYGLLQALSTLRERIAKRRADDKAVREAREREDRKEDAMEEMRQECAFLV
jgi:hypothetical protein